MLMLILSNGALWLERKFRDLQRLAALERAQVGVDACDRRVERRLDVHADLPVAERLPVPLRLRIVGFVETLDLANRIPSRCRKARGRCRERTEKKFLRVMFMVSSFVGYAETHNYSPFFPNRVL